MLSKRFTIVALALLGLAAVLPAAARAAGQAITGTSPPEIASVLAPRPAGENIRLFDFFAANAVAWVPFNGTDLQLLQGGSADVAVGRMLAREPLPDRAGLNAGVRARLRRLDAGMLQGKPVRITIRAMADPKNPAQAFAVSLANAEAETPWTSFSPGPEMRDFSYTVTFPDEQLFTRIASVGIWPDVDGRGHGILVDYVTVEPAEEGAPTAEASPVPAAPVALPEPPAPAMPAPPPTPGPEVAAAEPPPSPAPEPAPAAKPVTVLAPAPVPALAPAPVAKAVPKTPAPAAAPAPAAPARQDIEPETVYIPPRPADAGQWVAHLASYLEPQRALVGWKEIVGRAPSAFAGHQPFLSSVVIAGGKQRIRLSAAPFADQAAVDAFCQRLAKAWPSCEALLVPPQDVVKP
ncbi:hypothetical protein [Radicibacter daui]|uniref:hypothetical protein n=1 Tax=Radicibacter daui TaxID=3064829 RepID=UPI004046FD90